MCNKHAIVITLELLNNYSNYHTQGFFIQYRPHTSCNKCATDVYQCSSNNFLSGYARAVCAQLTTCCKILKVNKLVTRCSYDLLSSCNSTTCNQVVSNSLVRKLSKFVILLISCETCVPCLFMASHEVEKS